MESNKSRKLRPLWIVLKILGVAASALISFGAIPIIIILGYASELWIPIYAFACLALPGLLIPVILCRKRLRVLAIWGCAFAALAIAAGINLGINHYERSITIDTSPNIHTWEYLPFDPDSRIAILEEPSTLKLTDDLPRIDGAAALFPVYSAYVNAVYPNTVQLGEEAFQYNNTVSGYELLAQKDTDIFIGVYPSREQIEYAESLGTEFAYHQIGTEAFVFFVHRKNPIESLTTQQIQEIYSGKITNWKEVGGNDEPITAYQRNEGSGSQSMLIRFMDGKPLMEAPTELVNTMMSGIIEQVSDYRSQQGSIGFSYRFYVEGIIKNPDIKMIAVDGIAPTAQNIRNRTYPILTPIYAVTYENNPNPNVKKLVDWILSSQGQELLEKTGYVGN